MFFTLSDSSSNSPPSLKLRTAKCHPDNLRASEGAPTKNIPVKSGIFLYGPPDV